MEQNIKIKLNEEIQKMGIEQATEIIKEIMLKFHEKNSSWL